MTKPKQPESDCAVCGKPFVRGKCERCGSSRHAPEQELAAALREAGRLTAIKIARQRIHPEE